MSEEAKPKSKFDVTADDFVDFLVAVTPNSKCPGCGGDQWTTLSPMQEDADTYRLALPIRNADRPKITPAFGLSCNTCGFIRLHMAATVKNWVEDRNRARTEDLDPEQEELNGDE